MNNNDISQSTNDKQMGANSSTPVIKTILSKIIIVINNILEKIKSLWLELPEKLKKIIRIVALIFGVMIFLLIIFSIIIKFASRTPKPISLPSPSFEPSPTGEIIDNPSRWATDSGVIKISEDLSTIEKALGTMQVNETDLLPPKLDFDINFSQ